MKNDEIEWLRRTFQPQMETVEKLPDAKTIPDYLFVELKKSETERQLCVSIQGKWFLIAALNLIEGS